MSIKYAGKNEFDQEKYVIKVDDVTIGYIAIDFELQSIMNIWVHPDLRGKDYGTKLVKHVEALLISKGLKTIKTSPINDEFIGFFEKLGFTIDDEGFGLKKISTER